jgi:LDH2 family malate/lactate/ureidoglycolate dehydrogenase
MVVHRHEAAAHPPVEPAPGSGDIVVTAAELHAFIRRLFEALGMRAVDVGELADHLVWADLRGATWLGARKVPQYVARIRAGGTSADAEPVMLQNRGAFTLLDAKDTLGQIVAARAMRLAIVKARTLGVGVTSVRNTTSAGALGYYATLAAEERMIGMAINNSPALQPAWGGLEKVIGNQAFAVGSPAGDHDPVVVDMATSAMSWVRIHEYQQRGEPLPDGVALSAAGVPTVEPAEALAGILLPMGGHRGYGLSVLWELLTGALSGGTPFSDKLNIMPDMYDRPSGTSIFCLAINPEFSIPYDTYVGRVDEVIDRIKSSERAPGVEQITVPGERGHLTAKRRSQDGIPLPGDLTGTLRKLAAELDVSWI